MNTGTRSNPSDDGAESADGAHSAHAGAGIHGNQGSNGTGGAAQSGSRPATPASKASFRRLVDEAIAGYRVSGRFSFGFARGKLTGDPAFEWLLRQGLLAGRPRILDLGCGQGLLAALLLTARDRYERAARHRAGMIAARTGAPTDATLWPADWPEPPATPAVHGIELMASDVARADQALGDRARIVQGDMVDAPYSPSDAVVILDVLHYVDFGAQERVLDRVTDSLRAGGPNGRLLLRVGDAAGGWRFRATLLVDHLVMTIRGHSLGRLYCRPVADWVAALRRRGYRVNALMMSEGTPFANVLLTADLVAIGGASADSSR